MNLELSVYRARIGLFCGGGKSTHHGSKQQTYMPYSNSSDVHFRTIACFLVLIPIVLLCQQTSLWVGAAYGPASLNALTLTMNQVFDIDQLLLLLSGDVELNPGPTDMDTVLVAIKNTESRIMSKIEDIHTEISGLRQEVSKIQLEQTSIKNKLYLVSEKQKDIEQSLAMTDNQVEKVQGVSETLQTDVDHLINTVETQESQLTGLKKEVEQLNKKSIANNMRVFGLNVGEKTDYESVSRIVLKKVLQVACPHIPWSMDDIKNVRVIPGSNNSFTPLVIVTFRYDDDKYRIYSGREALRKQEIRVGDDLTYEQRQTLKHIKTKEGKSGYFYKGELHIRSEDSVNGASYNNREFVKARRRVQQNTDSNPPADNVTDPPEQPAPGPEVMQTK